MLEINAVRSSTLVKIFRIFYPQKITDKTGNFERKYTKKRKTRLWSPRNIIFFLIPKLQQTNRCSSPFQNSTVTETCKEPSGDGGNPANYSLEPQVPHPADETPCLRLYNGRHGKEGRTTLILQIEQHVRVLDENFSFTHLSRRG